MPLNIPELLAPMLDTHKDGANQTLKWRLEQMDIFMRMITECEKDFTDALYQDLRKNRTESMISEILIIRREIETFQAKLAEWMKPKKVASPAACMPSVCEILSVPLAEPGVLVIGPFNYPVSLPLLAMIGAIGGKSLCACSPS